MAVLIAASRPDWSGLVRFGGADAVLGAQSAALPQPDQLCGPFAAHAALHALGPPLGQLDEVPSMWEVALAAGTRIWPYDDPASRPAGAPQVILDDDLPRAAVPEEAGTDAAGLAAGVIASTGGRVAVVPVRRAVPGPWPADALLALLGDVAEAPYGVGVVANLATGPVLDEPGWDVGHFVVLWGVDAEQGTVAIADSYAELTGDGAPPGCRLVTLDALGRALGQEPGRGLLVLADPEHAVLLAERSIEVGMVLETWRT